MISFLDLHKINLRFEPQFREVFQHFLDSGHYILGNSVSNFESAYATYCGTKHCIGVANGLDALRLILEGYKILGKLQPGDEVIVAANTYIATIIAIQQAGLTPVLVEAEKNTYTLDGEALKKAITPKTKVLMPVHLYGQIAAMDSLLAIANQYGLLVVEDAAQSHGASYGNYRSGGIGHAAGHSFYPSKNLGALGDGGAVTTNDDQLAAVVRKWRNYGTSSKYVNEYCGVNSRLDELQAAVLSVKLPHLDADNQVRRKVAQRYLTEIVNSKIILPVVPTLEAHVFHLFVVRTPQRDHLQSYLHNHGIDSLIHYPIPPHQQQAFQELNHLSFPVTEEIHQTVLSIPISPVLEDSEVSYIIDVINRY